jgi:hypothetical protein
MIRNAVNVSAWMGRAAACALCLAVAVPARAQDEGHKSSVKDSERSMQDYAECVVARSKGNSGKANLDRYLRLTPSVPGYRKLGEKLATDACVEAGMSEVTMTFSPLLFRLSLYEARYRRDFGKRAAPEMADAPPLDLAAEFDAPVDELPREVVFLRQLGNCVARLDAAHSHDLVLSRMHTPAEAALITSLQPSLGVCVPEGATFRFSRTMLRGALAEALYKFQPQPQPTKVAK